jgi:hypothetical protein
MPPEILALVAKPYLLLMVVGTGAFAVQKYAVKHGGKRARAGAKEPSAPKY